MTEEDFTTGAPFWYYGHFQLMKDANPLKLVGKQVIDNKGEVFAELMTISGDKAFKGQFLYISKNHYGRFIIYFRECQLKPKP